MSFGSGGLEYLSKLSMKSVDQHCLLLLYLDKSHTICTLNCHLHNSSFSSLALDVTQTRLHIWVFGDPVDKCFPTSTAVRH